MNNPILSIDTYYDGHLFRSWLEARWAVFYHSLGIKYEYEKEGYTLPSGRYLPDFWLPEQQYWIEIKGLPATKCEIDKARELCSVSGYDVYIFDAGEIQLNEGANYDYNIALSYHLAKDGFVSEDEGYQWCQCPVCDKLGISYAGYVNRICDCQQGKSGRYDLLELAYINARKARFEFN